MITQQFLRLVQQLALMPRPGVPISPPQLLQNLFPCRMTHRFVHSATVTVGSGTTYLFPFLHHPSRVTKLLAQFVPLGLCPKDIDFKERFRERMRTERAREHMKPLKSIYI